LFKKIFSEPLLHFLVLGGVFFFVYASMQKEEKSANTILISQKKITQLIATWEKKFFRPPTAEEKQEMIDNEIYQTVLYKEALKIGLDKNDVIIKRRLSQKMEFVTYDTSSLPTPSNEILKAFMHKYPQKYSKEAKIHFSQKMEGSNATLFEPQYTLSKFNTTRLFGRSFANSLFELKKDVKEHKIKSAYGIHHVKIIDISPTTLKAFESVKNQVKNDYMSEERSKQNKAIYAILKSQYTIEIEAE